MYLMPLPFLLGTLAGLLSIAALAGGLYVVWAWYVGELVSAAWLAGGVAALLWSAYGRLLVLAFYPRGSDEPRPVHSQNTKTIAGADGSTLHVEIEGDPDKPVAILTHGWALDSTAWYYVRRQLSSRYRLVLWDLPGLGASSQPADGRYTVARLAEDLRRVIDGTADGPVTLVGHSIGGMMILTLCRLHPELLADKVRGIVLMDTTHVWPLRTVMAGGLLRLLRWPLIEPLLYLTILLWPLVWLMNWQSYFNGTAHLVNRLTSLSRDVTRGQLEFATRFNVKDKPSVVAKGLLAVLRWDEAETPAGISVPTLVITGDADRITLPEAGVGMSRMIPDAQLVRIDPAGHNGLLEEGQQYSDAIARLVQKAAGPLRPRPV
ncbi:MAG TPA: alpha/beta hydrolase [Rhodocyclaceae bacterium]|nr:alpha/beta hydrolase [Rhodocyclaceae bacterium]